jgi:site-specific DNA-methyltransferase (adenine-specific)
MIPENFLHGTCHKFQHGLAVQADCFEWIKELPDNSINGIVTDPPYGVKEYDYDQVDKRATGNGGIWRLPPSFDGHTRSPLPRFTALNQNERKRVYDFFLTWTKNVIRILCPGSHVFVASNSFLSQIVFQAISEGGLEFRGEIIRLVRTLRGGDRPKNAEDQYPNVCSLPRGCYEPWGIFRKPLPDRMTVSKCLQTFGTGGLRRLPNGLPFFDVIHSERTPKIEKDIADHPSLKPQSLLRQLVWAILPLGEGIILDPFMGSGSTIAAAEALNLSSIGIERHPDYYEISLKAIPSLSQVSALPD